MKITIRVAALISIAAAICEAQQNPEMYTVQLMATKEQPAACAYAEKMKKHGIEVSVEHIPNTGTPAPWKVRTGTFTQKIKAERYAATLKARGIPCWVTTSNCQVQESDTTAADLTPSRTGDTSLQDHPGGKTSEKPLRPVFTYKYFNPQDGALHITTSLKAIPESLRTQIKEISVYPVMVKGIDAKTLTVTIEYDRNNIKKVKLMELAYPERDVPVSCMAMFQNFIAQQRFRLIYRPGRVLVDGTIVGYLYDTDGTSLAHSMVKKGLAVHNPEGVTVLDRHMFKEAEENAKKDKLCIWDNP